MYGRSARTRRSQRIPLACVALIAAGQVPGVEAQTRINVAGGGSRAESGDNGAMVTDAAVQVSAQFSALGPLDLRFGVAGMGQASEFCPEPPTLFTFWTPPRPGWGLEARVEIPLPLRIGERAVVEPFAGAGIRRSAGSELTGQFANEVALPSHTGLVLTAGVTTYVGLTDHVDLMIQGRASRHDVGTLSVTPAADPRHDVDFGDRDNLTLAVGFSRTLR